MYTLTNKVTNVFLSPSVLLFCELIDCLAAAAAVIYAKPCCPSLRCILKQRLKQAQGAVYSQQKTFFQFL
jgi:hypothetical protein